MRAIRGGLLISLIVLLGGCQIPPSQDWVSEQCPPPDPDADVYCSLRVPPAALIVMPVEDRARGIWAVEQKQMLIRPFAGDVIAVITTDAPGSFTYMDRQSLGTTTLGEEQLWRRALNNVDDLARTATIDSYPDGLHWIDSDFVSGSALVMSKRLWKRKEFAKFVGPPLVGLADRSHFYVVDSGNPGAVAKLREAIGHGCHSQSDYPDFCSRADHLFVRDDAGTWRVFAP